ncbi:hypothetical protein NC651_036998 [Populus alba x Populus x berolinensis]|nr:hypothetical protein NC651_036998 [Populus alba x Populus x berolinensis]
MRHIDRAFATCTRLSFEVFRTAFHRVKTRAGNHSDL